MPGKPGNSKPGGDVNAADYFAAANDHAVALESLYRNGHYALTLYVSGLVGECLFRAFRAKNGLPFSSDHVLQALAEEAGFPELIPTNHRERFDAALADLIVGWRNSHRFRSNTAARRFLKDMKLDRKIKGDYLKENARRLSSAAIDLLSLGVSKWR